jgi:DNA (cytosine-5)-methyltransferase 1
VIVDLFAGPGGWDEGLALLDHRDVVGLEWDDDACTTAAAAGHVRVQADVAAIDPRLYVGAEGLIASPPCQDWSSAGRRSDGGTRDLTGEVPRWVRGVRPRWVVCEQVRDVLPTWQSFARELEQSGYRAWTGLVDAANFGVPQRRFRALLIAVLGVQPAHLAATHVQHTSLFGDPQWVTMADALGWDGYLDRRNNGAPIIHTDRPAPTVTGAGVGTGQWLYRPRAGNWRAVTVEEGATLQTFPPGYPWHGTKKSRGQQVGNAVPPLLAKSILAQFVQAREVAA